MQTTELIADWIDAWNRHDIDGIMAHYAEDVVFTAQTVIARWNKPDGRLNGKQALREHFIKGLELAPNLRFELTQVLLAPNGYAILYRRENGNSVLDAVELNELGLASHVTAYYMASQS